MSKTMKASVITAALIFGGCVAAEASPSHQDECSIWLCGPAGFPGSECSAAHSAFLWRLKHHKSPFPSFSSCSEDASGASSGSDDDFQVVQGYAALIPEHEETRCLESTMDYTVSPPRNRCKTSETYTVPAKYLEGMPCIHGNQGGTTPPGCRATYYFLKVFDREGNQIGQTYYYNY